MALLLKKLTKKMRSCILYFLSLFIIIFIRLLKPIILIRIAAFGGVLSSRIGHLAANLDVYLVHKKIGLHPRNSIDIFYISPHGIANEQLLKMWRRTNKIHIYSKFFSYVEVLNNKIPRGSLYLFHQSDIDTTGTLPGTLPPIKFSEEEHLFAEEQLKTLGILDSNKIICIHNRDPLYLEKFSLTNADKNHHSYRDSKIVNYLATVKKFTELGYYVVRLGVGAQEELNYHHPNFIQYATSLHRSDFLDIYLLYKCRFFIGSNTGLSAVNTLFRKPQVIVNHAPFQINELYVYAKNSIILPKKLRWIKNNIILSTQEISKIEFNIHYSGNFFLQNGIEVIENTPDEILNAALELEDRLNGVWKTSDRDLELQNNFWLYFSDSLHLINKLNLKMSTHFLEKYHLELKITNK